MKTKPIVITLSIVAVLVCGFLFARSKYLTKPEKTDIITFLNQFNANIQLGEIKSATQYFDEGMNKATVTMLVNVLSNKTSMGGKGKPLFKVTLNTDDSKITFINPELATADVPATFHRDSIPDVFTTITFTIHKGGANNYNIYRVDATLFNKDYTAYQNAVINRTVAETKLFSPQTLSAFKTANQLKARYDSILWFQHVDNKAWFYVVKGKLPDDFYWHGERDKTKPVDYKMGLVNPDLKEIIPVEYDLIHNIGGTIDGLIEVEKGEKKGLYDITGKLVVPVNFEQILPLNDVGNLALLKNGNDYSYFKNDMTIGETLVDFKIADVLPKVKHYADSYKVNGESAKNIMEYNDRNRFTSLVVAPSYLVEWHMLSEFLNLPNKLRTPTEEMIGDGDGSGYVEVKFSGEQKDEENWFTSAFYSVVNDYLGGRGGLYENKALLLVDKKQNRILGFDASNYFGEGEGGGPLIGDCRENSLKAINDSLFEFKTTSTFDAELLEKDSYIEEGPYYHYLQIKNGKLVAMESQRLFPTQFVKLDDSYLQGCYTLANELYSDKTKRKTVDHLTNDMLQYMKNEIYGSYHYKFKSPRWDEIFKNRFYVDEKERNVTVDDSLTTIDKYNINWINSKLNPQKPTVLAAQ
ncbi:MAG: YARHG domain-containing protein [Bacteroidota bacterium]